MMHRLAALLALALAASATSALACPGEKKSDGKPESSQPAKPKTST